MKAWVYIFASATFLRYVLSGATAAAVDVGLLYVLTRYLGIYYLVSAVVAVSVSFVVRFLLQKFFAFREQSVEKMHRQLGYYTLLYLASATSTLGFLYIFVQWVGLWYVAAQIIAILIVASVSFFVYRYIIFPPTTEA